VKGPDTRMPPRMALALAMALQELATNAIKYGALSRPEGIVDLSWLLDQSVSPQRLLLRWEESGGPPVRPPSHKGFGTRLIERSLASDLNANVQIMFEPGGLVCTIDARIPRPEDAFHVAAPKAASGSP
jgi:two-component sensor histidine kinase